MSNDRQFYEKINHMRVELKKLNPWWSMATINKWHPRQVMAIYNTVMSETDDSAFSRYVNAAMTYGDIEFQAEIMDVYNNRFY